MGGAQRERGSEQSAGASGDDGSHRERPTEDDPTSTSRRGVARSGDDRTPDRGALDATVATDGADPKGALDATVASDAAAADAATGSGPRGRAPAVEESSPRKRATAGGTAALGATLPVDAAEAAAAATQPRLVPAFGPYSRVEVLAEQGNMGLVARGLNDEFDRWELLKFLRPELADNAELARQFKREGRALAKLAHPNVVQVFATYEHEGRPCLSMEFLHGRSLGEALREAPLDVDRGLGLMLEAARGLAAAHELGLLHRDIKPDNLFVTEAGKGRTGGVKLIDFGLATVDRTRLASDNLDPSMASDAAGGTPLFMAPELWRGEEASPRTDLYAMGVTFYYAFTRRYPFEEDTVQGVRQYCLSSTPPVAAADRRRDLPLPVVAILDRLIAKDASDRPASAQELVRALEDVADAARPRKVPGSGPYRGLEPFTRAERDVFFGRDAEVAEIVERLRSQPGVVLVGPSGAGKSSLALAGVAPALEEGALGGGLAFATAAFEPRGHAVRSLAQALGSVTRSSPEELGRFVRSEPDRLGDALGEALPPSTGVVLVIDQLEEIATLGDRSDDTAAFAVALGSLVAAAHPAIRVIATVRADLMDRLFGYEPLRQLLTRGFYPVRPLNGEALRSALVEPARAAGYQLEDPSVADEIATEVGRTRAGLPLMSFAMAEWWKRRDEHHRVLPTDAWQELGGLAGALAHHADGVLASMGPAERSSAEEILVRLVTAEGTRQPIPRETLVDLSATGAAGSRALDRLLQAKLVVDSGGEIELVHDALVTEWQALRVLLAADSEDRAFRDRVSAAAREWDAHGRADGALWSGEQAGRLLAWFERTEANLDQLELAFHTAVRDRVRRRRVASRFTIAAGGLVVVVVVLVSLASARKMAAELAIAQDKLHAATKAHAEDAASALVHVAEVAVDRDPARALYAAQSANEHSKDPKLDVLAWQARAAGVAKVLPSTEAAIGRFDPSERFLVVATEPGYVDVFDVAGTGHEQLVGSPKPLAIAFDPTPRKTGAQPGIAIADAAGKVVVIANARGKRRQVATCEGDAARKLHWPKADRMLVGCGASTVRRLLVVDPTPGGSGVREPWAEDDASFAFADDGSAVARRSGDTVGIFTTDDETSLGIMDTDGASVTAIGIAPVSDGKPVRVVVGDADGRIASGMLESNGHLTWKESPHLGAVTLAAVSPDGDSAVSIDDRGLLVLWNADGEPTTIERTGSPAVAWLPGSRAVAFADAGHEVVLLSVDTGAHWARLRRSPAAITSLAASAPGGATSDQGWLVATTRLSETSARKENARAWSLGDAAARFVASHPRASTGRCAIASEATHVACVDDAMLTIEAVDGGSDGADPARVRRVDLPTEARGTVSQLVATRGAGSVLWTVDGSVLVLARAEDGRFDAEIVDLPIAAPITAAAHREQRFVIADSKGAKPQLRIVEAGVVAHAELDAGATALAFSPDDSKVALASDGKPIHVLDGANADPIATIDAKALYGATRIAFSHDGSHLAVAKREHVAVASIDGGKVEFVDPSAADVACLGWDRSGRAVVIGDASGTVRLVDADTKRSFRLSTLTNVTACAAREATDRWVLASSDGLIVERGFDTTPAWTAAPPEDPRFGDFGFAWRGLVQDAHEGRER